MTQPHRRSHRLVLNASLLAALLSASQAHATPQYVAAGTPLPRIALLKEGSHRYLRYVQAGDSNTPLDIWLREIRFDKERLQIRQRWDAVGKTASVKLLDSWFEKNTLRPLTHQRITEKDGQRVVEGFAFSPQRISGLPELADNTQKELDVPSPEPTNNFETDIEYLQALPLADGYEAQVNFYHAGGPAPARYTFKVAGSATIAGPAGPVDCWLVTTDYNKAGYVSKFWFAKASQLMVRQESPLPDGKLLIKTLIE
jgi:hypothetical protein